jgi:hypothetical protein
MISLDARRYNNFKTIYMDTVFDLLCKLDKREDKRFDKRMLQFSDSGFSFAKELVWYLIDYGFLYPSLTYEGTQYERQRILEKVDSMSKEELKHDLKPIILGNVEFLRDARNALIPPEKKNTSEQLGNRRDFSQEIKWAMLENDLMFDSKNHTLCNAPDTRLEDNKTLLRFIPYAEEKKTRNLLRKQKETDDKIGIVSEILERRWSFLEYFGETAYKNLTQRKPVCDNLPWKNMTVPACLVTLLELRSCPYCNRNYIGTIKGKNLGYQLDHYINKSMYPLFCLSLYNLVPSCSVCNGRKSNRDETSVFSPFEKSVAYDRDLDFYYVPPLRTKEEEGYLEIVVKNTEKIGKEKAKRYEKTIEMFDLNKCYKFNTEEADTFIEKMRYYPPSMISELGRTMSKSGNSLIEERMIEASMFQEGIEEVEAYRKHPLSMMYRHLYRKYRE